MVRSHLKCQHLRGDGQQTNWIKNPRVQGDVQARDTKLGIICIEMAFKATETVRSTRG